MVVLDGLFFIRETKNVVAGRIRQVVVLYSNDCTGFVCVDSALVVVLDEWSSYRGLTGLTVML